MRLQHFEGRDTTRQACLYTRQRTPRPHKTPVRRLSKTPPISDDFVSSGLGVCCRAHRTVTAVGHTKPIVDAAAHKRGRLKSLSCAVIPPDILCSVALFAICNFRRLASKCGRGVHHPSFDVWLGSWIHVIFQIYTTHPYMLHTQDTD